MNKQGPNGICYVNYTWNPVTGCYGPEGKGACSYCYAHRIADRFSPRPRSRSRIFDSHTVTIAGVPGLSDLEVYRISGKTPPHPFPFGFAPTLYMNRLDEPLRLRKPSIIFAVDMGDLLGDWVPDVWIHHVLDTMVAASQHTFLVLTKNPKRLPSFYWPKNAWIGTTVEDQQTAHARIPFLLDTCATVHWVSVEPMLGPVDLHEYLACEVVPGPLVEPRTGTIGGKAMPTARLRPRVDWVVIGGLSGSQASPPKAEWVADILTQCDADRASPWLKRNLKWPERIQYWPPGTADVVRQSRADA